MHTTSLPQPVKLSTVTPGKTCVYYSWGRGREVRVVSHDDCGLTTLQDLRTRSTWTVSSFTNVHTTEPVKNIYSEAKRRGVMYLGPRMNGA